MASKEFDRFEYLKNEDGTYELMPFVSISESLADITVKHVKGRTFDKLAQKYYNNPLDDVFIFYANPQYIDQFDIPEGALIRIPFPLERAKSEVENYLKKFKEFL